MVYRIHYYDPDTREETEAFTDRDELATCKFLESEGLELTLHTTTELPPAFLNDVREHGEQLPNL